jgi:hypothetical protein
MSLVRHPYVLAILLHIAVFAALAVYSTNSAILKDAEESAKAAATSPAAAETASYSATNAPYAATDVQAKLDKSIAAAGTMSPTEQLGAANDFARQLESISSVGSMKEIGAYLRPAPPSRPRGWPPEPGMEKVFDHATSTAAGARQRPDGSYVFVFKDAGGNVFETPAAPDELNAARALALLDRSDVLKEFKNSVLLPVLNKRLDPE